MTALVLIGAAWVLLLPYGVAVARYQRGRSRQALRVLAGWSCLIWVLMIGAAVALDARWLALVGSPVLAFWLWVWWTSGGGDGTKRRLRSAWRRFQPVRRTAPVVSG